MKRLNNYIPYLQGEGSQPYLTLVEGDQLSCERMITARTVMADHTDPKNTLKGMEPSPQEFHHLCLTLQVGTFTSA